jgi:hypothetical protein
MNFKTFMILFLLGISCSCSWHYEKTFGDESNNEHPPIPENR